MVADHRTVPVGVVQEQQYDRHAGRLELELDSSIECLHVANTRLGFDSYRRRGGNQQRIPRSGISGTNWDLRPPRKSRVEHRMQPAEQRQVRGVAKWPTAGISASAEIETDNPEQARYEQQWNLGKEAALDTADRRRRDTGRCSNVALARSGGSTCHGKLDTEIAHGLV